jgi:hypothetical protein
MNKMTKSIPINDISTNDISTNDDQTIQEVLQSLDVDIQEYPDEEFESPPPTLSASSGGDGGPYNAAVPTFIQPSTGSGSFGISQLSNDIVNLIVVFVVFVVISATPIEKFIYKYISIEHIPMSQLLIKAFFAAIAFFVIKKLIHLI